MLVVLAATGLFVYLGLRSALTERVDDSLASRAGVVEALLRERGRADPDLTRGLDDPGDTFTQVIGPGERVAAARPALRDAPLLDAEARRDAAEPTTAVVTGIEVDEEGFIDPEEATERSDARVLSRPVEVGGRRYDVLVGEALEERDEAVGQLGTILLIGLPVALLLACAVGYGAVAGALRPVERMRRHAAEVSGSRPGRRLPVPAAEDELGRLAVTLNEMLGRLERALERERALAADAGHELRTPLAIMKTELELALQGERSAPELRAAIASAGEEVDRLTGIAEDLLLLAGSDRGKLPLRVSELDAAELLERVRQRFEARAAEAGRQVRVSAAPGLFMRGDPVRLEQALGNLLENALRHGAGSVELTASNTGEAIELAVRDQGEGFPEEFLPRAFERFSRADSGRTSGGSGLGLSIVAVIAAAHGGSAAARNLERGAEVALTIPSSGPS